MSDKILAEINRDQFRANLSKYTRKAFQYLPLMENPRILDIGCGSGVPTIELARLSNGKIIGIDIDQSLLDKLIRKINDEGFSDRVTTVRCSLLEIDFPEESFEIIWAEGSIWVIGFEKGLKEWNQLLKTYGYMVIHDEIKNETDKLKIIPKCGYELLNTFRLSKNTWWEEYYKPLENRLRTLFKKYGNDIEANKILKKYQNEVDMFKKTPNNHSSVFYILKKI
jgi:ubiquinone/menaquinone biosynthesis C-methylase UbiE